MKKIYIFAIVFAFVVLVFLWNAGNSKHTEFGEQKKSYENTNASLSAAVREAQNNVPNGVMTSMHLEDDANTKSKEFLKLWQKEISFYGKVLDENNYPIQDANVLFQWNATASTITMNTCTSKSDSNGLFSITGIHGPSLSVIVSKDGYLSGLKNTGYSFLGGEFYPDLNNPVIYRLYKCKETVDFITSQVGIKPFLEVKVKKDGSQTIVDLLQKKIGENGQIVLSQLSKKEHESEEWQIKIEMKNGYIAKCDDDCPYMAPTNGFQRIFEYTFKKSETNWTSYFASQYYIVFDDPKIYGSLKVEFNYLKEKVLLTYSLNPSGSRYLVQKKENFPSNKTLDGVQIFAPEFK